MHASSWRPPTGSQATTAPRGSTRWPGPGIDPGEGPEISLADFAGQIAGAVGLEPDPEWGRSRPGEAVGVFSEEEERLVEERLRGLGYLE